MYPLSLDLSDRHVLVVGGGSVATRRVCGLLAAGAHVAVVAPEVTEELRELAETGRVRWFERRFRTDDLSGPERVWLVHTATGDLATDDAVAHHAQALGIWCVRADDATRSSAWTPATAEGPAGGPAEGITVAVTADRDPRRAVAVRDAVLAGLASGTLPVRRQRAGRDPSAGRPASATRRNLPDADALQVGRVYLVGGGPGDPGLVTVRGRALLAAADVVVVDRLGPRALLADLDPEVLVVEVGKTPGHHPVPQETINELLVEHARAGRTVVRLKGGDPFVLGRGGEEALHCVARGIPVEVVPGVSSAVAVPAAAGIPVTHRGVTGSFVVASAHDGAGAALDAARRAPAGATLVLLMGVSVLADTANTLMAHGWAPEVPVAIVESGWTPRQRTTVTTLQKAGWVAEHEGIRSPAVVVVGDVVGLRERLGDLTPGSLPT
ncbi:MAG: uroporphyrinogen-III C-methyltransferase [Dermatophilaceae bacterium]